jgi:dienelactone hydrolase
MTSVAALMAALCVVVVTPNARADGPALGLGQLPFYEDDQASFAWQGTWTSNEVMFPSVATGAHLYAVLFTPKPKPNTKLPAVVIVPGSGPGVQSFYHWAARDLAGHGYVALAVDPQGAGRSDTFGHPPALDGVPFQQAGNFVDAFASGIAFLAKQKVAGRFGVAGHSLGARAASWIQTVDRRIKAVVAWDNLASDLQGDEGSASGGGAAAAIIGGELPSDSKPVTPRVPALGMASDNRGGANDDPDQKKTAYEVWRKARVPSMELVMRDVGHNNFAQTRQNTESARFELFAYYTRAWFDRFLRNDRTATQRLIANTVVKRPRKDVLSETFRSAAYLDGIDCADFVSC